ncbi:MAG: DUF305 domain-containing protein [Gemmatimonadota bacterium]|nr:DUF305 domain-containing protein [Gemmatimonadota bacterium]
MSTVPGLPRPPRAAIVGLLCAATSLAPGALSAQTTRTVQPGAPGEETRVLDAAGLDDLTSPEHTEADVAFMRGMISHHAQAIEMVALIADRTSDRQIGLLGRRIEISQRDEIALMERWLETRGEEGPANHGHGEHGAAAHAMMPGMLSFEQMAELEAADGVEFERLFLTYMIQHHQGAIDMVVELFASNGGQQVDVFRFASDVDADQQMEIDRMRLMLEARDPAR